MKFWIAFNEFMDCLMFGVVVLFAVALFVGFWWTMASSIWYLATR